MKEFLENCESFDIGAYIDGELDHASERAFEEHASGCANCRFELNSQKQFLMLLDGSLKDGSDIEMPPNFTRQVVAKAENNVEGLRRSSERFNTIFVCAALLLFGLFALGAESASYFGSFAQAIEKAAAIGSFVGHMVYSFLVGTVVVIRTAAGLFPEGSFYIALILIFFALLPFGTKILRLRRI